MRSRTSLFNATLFKKTIVRFWPVWFLYAFVWLLAFPAGIGGALMRSLRMEDPAPAVLYVIAGRWTRPHPRGCRCSYSAPAA